MRLILSFTCVQRENNRISLFREGGADGPSVWRACLSIYLSAYVSLATKIHSCSVHGTDASRWHDVWLPVEVTWAQPHNNRHHFNLAISTQFVSMALKVDGFLRKHWLPWRPDTVVTQSNKKVKKKVDWKLRNARFLMLENGFWLVVEKHSSRPAILIKDAQLKGGGKRGEEGRKSSNFSVTLKRYYQSCVNYH